MSLSDKISALRKRKGWTQQYLAEKLGVQKTQITRWETGRSRPSMPMLKKLAPVLGLTTEQLLESHEEAALPELDSELTLRVRQLQELSQEERTVIFRVIDTFARQSQMAKMFQPTHSQIAS